MSCSSRQGWRWWPVLALALVCGPLSAQEGAAEAAAQRLMLEAQRQLQSGNPGAALSEYRALLDRFPQSSQAPQALIESAQIHYRSGNYDSALSISRRLVDDYASSAESAAALVLQARITLERASALEDVEAARMVLNRIPNLYGTERFPELRARAEARVLGAEASALLSDYGPAQAGFLEALEDEARGAWTPMARLGLARVLLLRGDWVPALQLLQAVIDHSDRETPPAAAQEARALLSLAHRMWIRPQAFEPRWQTARRLPLPSLRRPRGVAASRDGSIAVSDQGAGNLTIVDPQGAVSASAMRSPGRPWFDADGTAHVVLPGGIFDLTSRRTQSFSSGGERPKPLDKLEAGARGLFGRLIVLDRAIDSPAVYTRDGRLLETLPLSGAVDVAGDGRGQIYVLTNKPHRVSVFGPDNRLRRAFSTNADRPTALDVDELGNVYLLDIGRKAVEVTDPNGASLVTLGPLLPGGIELRGPEDLAVDGSGRILIADSRLSALVALE